MSFLKEYTFLGELGDGGFAKVYKVRQDKLGYIRAIRVLKETVTDEQSNAYQAFLRECKVLLRLGNGNHRNIVHIYQPRLLDNHALVEMDYVDGKNIAQYLKDNGGFLPIDEVLNMVREISSALAYCHEDIYKFCMDPDSDHLENDPIDGTKWLIDETKRQELIEKYRVIHNDIHSGNIMRREDGSFVLLDFGLAITGNDDVRLSSRHENGAVEFKAPEKWDNDEVLTAQSDIYSFGIVMFEYLTGRVPFPFDKQDSDRTKAAFEVSKAHREKLPPSIYEIRKSYFEKKFPGRTYQKDYPDWLEKAILKCLAKNPSDRFRNGKELYECVLRNMTDIVISKNEYQSVLDENASLNQEFSELSQELARVSRQVEVLMDNNGKLTADLETAKREKETLSAQVTSLKKEVEDARKRVSVGKDKKPVTIEAVYTEDDFTPFVLGRSESRSGSRKVGGGEDKGEEQGIKKEEGKGKTVAIVVLAVLTVILGVGLAVNFIDNRGKSNEVSRLQEQVSSLQEGVANSDESDALSNAKAEIKELKEQISSLEQQPAPANESDLEKQLKQANANISNLKKEVSQLNNTIKEKDREISVLRASL